jgi:hypothetical protein
MSVVITRLKKKSQRNKLEARPSEIAMNGIGHMRYWGDNATPVMIKARIAAPVYRSGSSAPVRQNLHMTRSTAAA